MYKLLNGKVVLLLLSIFHEAFSYDDLICSDGNSAKQAPILDDANTAQDIVTVGEKIQLYCCFLGAKPLQVKWFKNENLLTTKGNYSFTEANQVLSISKTVKSDHGVYRCEGSNKFGQFSWNITLDVLPPFCKTLPLVCSPKPDVTAKISSSVTLTCIVHYKAKCTSGLQFYFWKDLTRKFVIGLRNHKNIRVSHYVNKNDDVVMEMKIIYLKKRHEGEYECGVNGSRGVVSSKVKLTVNKRHLKSAVTK
ncbi:fibroblast growth factor receptor-like [Xenia sp. Carnegie-2017]|uniref:fibroblast growth factor receptor-like n=1 Tax=Xenia sp. Carnegie-2017 TaxID=2897299 RepID=UPI001F0435E3|nr:fibroblast growth factor receptor-like [Xenia sp. Carnegie-2017]